MLELVRKWHTLKAKHEDLSAKIKEIDEEWRHVELRLLEAMAEEGVGSVQLEDGSKVTMKSEHYFSVTIPNRPRFFEWLRDTGNASLIKEEVNARTLASFMKKEMDEEIRKLESSGVDGMEAEEKAIKKFIELGASYFKKRTLK